MSQADLHTVLSHLQKLQPQELREVSRAVRERLAIGAVLHGDDQEAFLNALPPLRPSAVTLTGAPRLTFVSADRELNAAALSKGLVVDDPNAHP